MLDGYDACLARLVAADPRAAGAEVLACSSAGGGLRIAVVGNEPLVTAEAGRRVALSSGGKVVHVLGAAGGAGDFAGPRSRRAPTSSCSPAARTAATARSCWPPPAGLVAAGWTGPVVVAGNVDARADVAAVLDDVPHVLADNVVPRIGVLAPESARAAVREVFLAHVIGGKHLSARTDFTAMVRGATPDLVLSGVELLARGLDDAHPGVGDVVVVDVGGATTDVHSVVEIDPDTGLTEGGLSREVVATTPVTRTVEGDLGMRWSAVSTVEQAAVEEPGAADGEALLAAASRRRDEPGFLPGTEAERDDDERIARAAIGLALRRHAGRSRVVLSPEGRVVERSGKDLREVGLVVGSGGVLRHGRPGVAARVLAGSTGADLAGGWQLPRSPEVVVDADYVLAAAGLLAGPHPVAAYRLALRVRGGPGV